MSKKKGKFKIDWRGNDGRARPAPGTAKSIKCGVCGINMKVERNVLGATSFAESVAKGHHRHDSFICIYKEKIWHRKITKLKMEVYLAKIDDNPFRDEIKSAAKKKILKLLKLHKAQ